MKLRKAIIWNCVRDIVNCISECVLNFVNGKIVLTDREKRAIRKHKIAPTKFVDVQVPLPGKNV